MSIERMSLVNIDGPTKYIDSALQKLSECGCFHMESAVKVSAKEGKCSKAKQENPYAELLKKINEIGCSTGFKFENADYTSINDKSIEKIDKYLDKIATQVNDIKQKQIAVKEQLSVHKQALYQVNHLKGLNFDLDKFFSCEYIKVRFGRLPVDSYKKLPYYEDKVFYFAYFSEEQDYYWGMYFTPLNECEEVDEVFDSLYFERIYLPDFVHGDSDSACDDLNNFVSKDTEDIEKYNKQLSSLTEKEKVMLNMVYSKVRCNFENYDLRKNIAVINDRFYAVGFIPTIERDRFSQMFDEMKKDDGSVVIQPATESEKLSPPIKIKNSKFAEPFSMFVKMYGLPSYNGINPTSFVAVTYTLLFGIMFGDLGQGLLIAIAGFLLHKLKKNQFGAILERIGISSAVFGTLYGSVFGFEELLDPLYESLGISFLPFKAMNSTSTVLLGAIALGVVLIIVSILMNVIVGFKNKDYERAVFGNNGIIGLVFFGGLLAGVAGKLADINLFTPVYIVFALVLPLLIMFFREPLGCLLKHKKFKMDSAGDFIASNFFEVFEFLLGYATNTLSFVRIGGFVLSHAAMMSVVMLLSERASAGASPIIIVIGNLFVMGMEGLIVGIQVLRLEFYEIFSRFYDGDGKEFKPVSINYDGNSQS